MKCHTHQPAKCDEIGLLLHKQFAFTLIAIFISALSPGTSDAD